ncbi:MAG TPA: ribose 5-phosphate isomerase B [Bacteroidia bacterium]|nr:ribose 5-phosphate isomerase B [Bacteroidia bacterium]HRH07142.1 ribose 5-phosphate isomerase B [Bacteroidia bacterium]HRH62837.1 ribose 5-phosphate isomerase B [Bacteroidia bacterium]
MKIAIGADHAGYNLKEQLIPVLKGLNCDIIDVGTHSAESVDYPDFAHPVAKSVEEKECAFGILICGSGNGVNITANKHQGIRSALCWNVEISKLARQHNDANIIALPARYIGFKEASEMVEVFISTPFEGGRHSKRVDKISC